MPHIKKLKDYENARKKEIKRLVMYASSKDYGKEVRLSFGASWSTINVDIEGPEAAVESHLTRIEEAIDGMKPWYAWLATVNFVLLLSLCFTIGITLWIALAAGATAVSQLLVAMRRVPVVGLRGIERGRLASRRRRS